MLECSLILPCPGAVGLMSGRLGLSSNPLKTASKGLPEFSLAWEGGTTDLSNYDITIELCERRNVSGCYILTSNYRRIRMTLRRITSPSLLSGSSLSISAVAIGDWALPT